MKKIISILLIVFSVFMMSSYLSRLETIFPISNGEIHYAKITSKNAHFYKYPNVQNESKLFLLPETYFVIILENYNATFIKIQYLDLIGYAKKNDISAIEEKPKHPFLENITFNISDPKTPLKSQPNEHSSSKLQLQDETELTFIGKIKGEELIDGLGNIWYYCKITHENENLYGYVYAPKTNNLTAFSNTNIETTPINIETILNAQELLYLDLTLDNILLLILLIPAVIAMIFLSVSSRSKSNKKQK